MKKMYIYKSFLFVAVISMVMVFASSCKNNDNDNGGAPYISYIRVSNPASADSLLEAGSLGQMIAIVGGNLGNTRQVWFNDQESLLTPTYMTNTVVFATIPSTRPSVVTNQLKLVFANGDSLLYPFTVVIAKPSIKGADKTSPYGMDCEYVPDGEFANIYGQFFYPPLTVTFAGGKTASTEDADDPVTVNTDFTTLTVKVPEGAQPGQISITTNFGTAKSDFWFRDDRNIFQGFEGDPNSSDLFGDLGTSGGLIISDQAITSPSVTINAPGADDPPLINGNYLRMIFNGQTWWTQLFCNWSNGFEIPDEIILHPNDYYLKFEVCTTKPYNGSGMKVWLTPQSVQNKTSIDPNDANATIQYGWNPIPFDTKGVWQTVIIPLEDIAAAEASGSYNFYPSASSPNGYFCGFVYAGNDPLDCDMSFDNFRIVPKVIR